jgi:hypothetical protein
LIEIYVERIEYFNNHQFLNQVWKDFSKEVNYGGRGKREEKEGAAHCAGNYLQIDAADVAQGSGGWSRDCLSPGGRHEGLSHRGGLCLL